MEIKRLGFTCNAANHFTVGPYSRNIQVTYQSYHQCAYLRFQYPQPVLPLTAHFSHHHTYLNTHPQAFALDSSEDLYMNN